LGTILLGQAGFADTYDNLLANVGGYLNTEAATVTDGPITVAEALALQAITTGPVTATISDTDPEQLLLLEENIAEFGNNYAVSVAFGDIAPGYGPTSNITSMTVTGDAFSNYMDFGGANFDLTVEGLGRDDEIIGGFGDDYLSSGDGSDAISGGSGADSIFGGAGQDYLFGGEGADQITGGMDADTVIFDAVSESAATVAATTVAGFDTITDFGATDTIYLGLVNSALTGGAAASVITLTQLALTDTTIADFSELAAAILADGGLDASSDAGLQAYLVDLTGNTGALGTGSYLLVNDNDTTMDGGDLMVTFTSPPQELDAQSFTF
jgi:Ca2+-binding RTX toxin-like protein